MDTKISAVITTKSRVQLLKRAVQSVLDQTYPHMEMIIVDDASEDETQAYCLGLSAERPEINYIRIEKEDSQGGNHARNVGIEAASGEYIAFLDDDDAWLPEKTAKQAAELMKHPECIGVTCYYRMIYSFGMRECSVVERTPCNMLENEVFEKQNGAIFYTAVGVTSALLLRKRALTDVGGFDTGFCALQEFDLVFRLRQKGTFCYVAEALTDYYNYFGTHNDQISCNMDKLLSAFAFMEKKYSAHFAQLEQRHKTEWAIYKHTACFERCMRIGLPKQGRRYLLEILKISKNPKAIAKLALVSIMPHSLYIRIWFWLRYIRSRSEELLSNDAK